MTIDEGVWEQPREKQRRTITIKQKLEVLQYRKQVIAELQEANRINCSPYEKGVGPAKREEVRDAKKKAKAKLAKGVEKACKEKFGAVIGGAKICRWEKACRVERWEDLPDAYASMHSTTNNEWRRKIGAPLKGQKQGGSIPLVLQVELDRLIMEITQGVSEISERREVVTAEQVVAFLHNNIFIAGLFRNMTLLSQNVASLT